jgi:TolA-binding protein
MRLLQRGMLACALLGATVCWAQTYTSPTQSRTELETQARDLDHRAVELQHEIMAVRQDGNATARERAEAELKALQAQRIDAFRTLGVLP